MLIPFAKGGMTFLDTGIWDLVGAPRRHVGGLKTGRVSKSRGLKGLEAFFRHNPHFFVKHPGCRVIIEWCHLGK